MNSYLINELPKYITEKKRFSYAFLYHCIKLRRFSALNIIAFSFQYLCAYHLQAQFPIYPVYPVMGIAFTVVAILGPNALLGLSLGVVCAYYLKGFSVASILLYSSADIACAYLAAHLCRNIFTSDIPYHGTMKSWARFTRVSASVCCLSGFLRLIALVLADNTLPSFMTLFYIYIDLWLADLNAIIIFYAFLSTWLSIYMSRERMSTKKINYYQMAAFAIFVIMSIVMMKKIVLIYLLVLGMGATIFFAYAHGIVIATLLVYVISMLYLGYFMGQQIYFIKWLGLAGYTLIPGMLFLFVLGVGCVCYARRRVDTHPSLGGCQLESS